MVYVSNTDAGKKINLLGQGQIQPKCLDGFTLLDLQSAQYLKNLPLLSIYQNQKLHLTLTQQNIYDFSTPPHCERPDGKYQPASKQNPLQSFRQDTRSARARGVVPADLVLHQRKGSSSRRELLSNRSTEKVPCPARLLPVFQEFFSFHNGAKSRMFIWALPENIPKEMELNNTTALNLQHPVSTSLAAAGKPWAQMQNRRQKTSQCKDFSTFKGQSGCRNKSLLVLSYMSLQEWKKNPHFVWTFLLHLQDSHNCLTWPSTEKKIL